MLALQLGEDGLEGDMEENLLFIPFTADEIAAVRPLMREYERLFGFDSAGETVEQLIDTRCAGIALDAALAQAQNSEDALSREVARKMARALEEALECGSFVEFDFPWGT